MLDIVYNYQSFLENISSYIQESKFKKDYFIQQLNVSKATFYNKIKHKSFTVNEMVILSKMLFPEEAKAFEIKQALEKSKNDSNAGRVRHHKEVMNDIRKKLHK